MSSDDDWYSSFKDIGEHGVFGQHLSSRGPGYFGGGPYADPPVPSTSPLSTRFRYDPSYLRVDQYSKSINNVKHPFAQWHNELKELLPGEQLRVKQFKWVTGGAICGEDLPETDDLGDGREFPKTTLLWLIHKFIRSEGIEPSLTLVEFSGKFSPSILGTLGDGDQSEIIQFLQYLPRLSHLKIAHRLVPPKYRDNYCSLVADNPDPLARFDYHWHVPLACGICEKLLKHLELILGYYDTESLTTLLDAPFKGALERLSIQFRPVHDDVQLGEFLHIMTAVSLANLTHLSIGLAGSRYNATGKLPRFIGPNSEPDGEHEPNSEPDPEHEPNFVGAVNDTYFTSYMFDLATKLQLFRVNFGKQLADQPLLDHCFSPDMRRFLSRQEWLPHQRLVQFEGVRVVGCKFRTFLLYLQTKLPRLRVSTKAQLISIRNGNAKVEFKISRARDCSTRARVNWDCGACRSLYPVVLHTISKIILDYSDQPNAIQIFTKLTVPHCVLDTLSQDLNTCPTRQGWVYLCLPEIDVQDRERAIVYIYYRRSGRILEVIFRNDKCEFLDYCPVCASV